MEMISFFCHKKFCNCKKEANRKKFFPIFGNFSKLKNKKFEKLTMLKFFSFFFKHLLFFGMTGFEPATPCSQSICATKLRYIPFLIFVSFFFTAFYTLLRIYALPFFLQMRIYAFFS